MSSPGFWDNQEKAREVVAELKPLKSVIDQVQALESRAEDARALLELAREMTRMIHGEPVPNRDALANPEALEQYAGIV